MDHPVAVAEGVVAGQPDRHAMGLGDAVRPGTADADPVRAFEIESKPGLWIGERSIAAERNRVKVSRGAAVESFEQSFVGAQHHGAVIVVWQAFRVTTELVWIEILVLVVGMLEFGGVF